MIKLILIIWFLIGFFSFIGFIIKERNNPLFELQVKALISCILATLFGLISFFIYFGNITIYKKRS